MKNNKARYKAMKKSSPMVQYKRMILGKHYRNGYGVSASDIVGFPIPRVLQERIKEQWKEFQRTWSHAEVHVIRKGRVAERLNRRWIGIELNPKCIDIAKKRTDNVQTQLLI